MGQKTLNLAAIAVISFSCFGCSVDPYAKNPMGLDPFAVPLAKRRPADAQPTMQTLIEDFEHLPRPIVREYRAYKPSMLNMATYQELEYTHVILSTEACAFVRQYTYEELLIALYSLLHDPVFDADAYAILSVMAGHPSNGGNTLDALHYKSPTDRGEWNGYDGAIAEVLEVKSERVQSKIAIIDGVLMFFTDDIKGSPISASDAWARRQEFTVPPIR